MKKRVTAILLSLVVTMESFGSMPAFAAEDAATAGSTAFMEVAEEEAEDSQESDEPGLLEHGAQSEEGSEDVIDADTGVEEQPSEDASEGFTEMFFDEEEPGPQQDAIDTSEKEHGEETEELFKEPVEEDESESIRTEIPEVTKEDEDVEAEPIDKGVRYYSGYCTTKTVKISK